jgi:uncharacterized protein (TIGR02246 family)
MTLPERCISSRLARRTARLAAAILVVAAAGCSPSAPEAQGGGNEAQDRAAIEKLRDDFQAAWNSNDAQRAAALYADDAVRMAPGAPTITGRSGIAQEMQQMFTQFEKATLQLSGQETRIMGGGWAFDRGAYTLNATPKGGGPPIADKGKYFVLLQKQTDGSWKVARDIDNSDTPPPMPPPAAEKK